MEENLKRNLYKLELQLIKVIPIIIAILSFIDTILSYLDIDGVCIAYVNALLVWSFLYLSSFVFRFCRWHRMFLYYILVEGIINWYDYTYIIPLDLKTMIVIQLSLFLIFTCTAIYLKKHDKLPCKEYTSETS